MLIKFIPKEANIEFDIEEGDPLFYYRNAKLSKIVWILSTGAWVDHSLWLDSATWRD